MIEFFITKVPVSFGLDCISSSPHMIRFSNNSNNGDEVANAYITQTIPLILMITKTSFLFKLIDLFYVRLF